MLWLAMTGTFQDGVALPDTTEQLVEAGRLQHLQHKGALHVLQLQLKKDKCM
jgi:hypothetical protein